MINNKNNQLRCAKEVHISGHKHAHSLSGIYILIGYDTDKCFQNN